MPSNMSNYLENAILGKILANAAFTPPSTVYLGLCTAFTTANDGDTFTEVSATGTAYARRSISFAAPTGSSSSNSAKVSFPKATADWGTVNYWFIADAANAGNVLYWGAISNPLSVLNGELIEIDTGLLTVSFAGAVSTTLAQQIINSTLRGQAWTLTQATHVALFTAYTNDSTYTECADANYARQSVAWSSVTAGASSNTGALQWNAAATGYTATHAAVFTALTNGTMLFRAALSASKAVGAGKNFRFEIGDLTSSLD